MRENLPGRGYLWSDRTAVTGFDAATDEVPRGGPQWSLSNPVVSTLPLGSLELLPETAHSQRFQTQVLLAFCLHSAASPFPLGGWVTALDCQCLSQETRGLEAVHCSEDSCHPNLAINAKPTTALFCFVVVTVSDTQHGNLVGRLCECACMHMYMCVFCSGQFERWETLKTVYDRQIISDFSQNKVIFERS